MVSCPEVVHAVRLEEVGIMWKVWNELNIELCEEK